MLFVFCLLCVCACTQTKPKTNLEFPGTSWDMNLEEVRDALDIQEKDILYANLGRTSSSLHIGNHELFGEKTKVIEFVFIDFAARLEKDFGTESWYEKREGQDLFDLNLLEIDDRFLELCKRHKLSAIAVYYPDDTNMENVLKKMKKVYGDTIPEICIYEEYAEKSLSRKPAEYQDSEQVKIWGTDFVTASIPPDKSEIFRDAWEPFDFNKSITDYKENTSDMSLEALFTDNQGAVSWDTFLTTARMQSIVYQNEDDRKKLMFWAYNGDVVKTLQQKMSQ